MRDNAEQLKELGRKAVIVTTKFVGDAPNLALQETEAVLNDLGTAYVILDKVETDPPVETIVKLYEELDGFWPDYVIGVGGGAALDVAKALADIKAGKVEYRLDKSNIIHVIIGKKSFTDEQLIENANTLIQAIAKAKPSAAKGQYFRSITLSATMSPGVKINTASLG